SIMGVNKEDAEMELSTKELELLRMIAERLQDRGVMFEPFGVQVVGGEIRSSIGIRVYVDDPNVSTFFRKFIEDCQDLEELAKVVPAD
ncbi:MAG TPA: hypothetical protein VFY10_15820, partial [Dehalococcoidia bacterium]|nr:hypothetical protein [Dehalococcoidia bacterium]